MGEVFKRMSCIDLHIHSNSSLDGELSVEQILALSDEKELSVISVTDHNSITGVKHALEIAHRSGITVLPGIEIDCVFHELNLHVLGYGIDVEQAVFVELEQTALEQEYAFFPSFITRLQELGLTIDEQEVLESCPSGIPAPEFVAEVLLHASENLHDARLLPYRTGGSRSEMPYVNFYRDYCTKGKPAYIEKQYPGLRRVIQLITESGGVPILAHPGESLDQPEEQLPTILKMGIEGIEVFSSYHTPAATRYYVKKAQKYGLLMTCGTDFHGKNKQAIELGSVECDGLEQQIVEALLR